MNLVQELKWRGLIHDMIPGTEELLSKPTTGYVGFDPTATSLTIGNLVTIMLLIHMQRAGHKPIALVGGATGMIGDPSGKSEERNLLSPDDLKRNEECIKKQLSKFLDFNGGANAAELVNNFDWFKDFSLLEFLRKVGKHLTVNYMTAKDSVKSRMETGLSFTEFTYQLIQGYDFYWLYKNKNCKLQMGGSDQWGNITAGNELIRRMDGGEAFAITCPLITKADGTKFGKSEGGQNIWLDENQTSPYKFYQFWLNCSDEDASKFIRIFTLLDQEQILELEKAHAESPHERALQKRLADEITTLVHSEEQLVSAKNATEILFGNSTLEKLKTIPEKDLLMVFEGVPQKQIARDSLAEGEGIDILDLVAEKTDIIQSKGEARRLLKDNGISVNKEKVKEGKKITVQDLLNDKYIIIQRGKKNYFLVKAQ